MVDPVSSFDPIAYIQGINSSLAAANQPAPPPANSSSPTNTTTPTTDTLGLSPAVLSVLQNSSSSALSTLLNGNAGGVSNDNPLAGVYDTLLFNTTTAQPYQTALNATQQQQTETQAQTNQVQKVLNAYTTATNAYNQTLLQNAQAVQAANSFDANGQPLVA